MSFRQKIVAVTLVNFILIMAFYLFRLVQMNHNETFNESNIFGLWGIVIFLAVVVSVLAIIITQFGSTIIQAIRSGDENPEFDDLEDERDNIIDLKGTKATYTVSSFGSLLAMLTYVYGQPPLVMFSLLIFFGVLAQIVGDIRRLMLYRRGF